MNASHITVTVILYVRISGLRDSRVGWAGSGLICEVDPILTLNAVDQYRGFWSGK